MVSGHKERTLSSSRAFYIRALQAVLPVLPDGVRRKHASTITALKRPSGRSLIWLSQFPMIPVYQMG